MLATIGGLFALVSPFASSAPPWAWRITSQESLQGTSVNADPVSVDEGGALLTPQGERAISVITSPLELPPDTNRVLVVRAAMPDLPEGESRGVTMNLLWQTEPVPEFRFVPHDVVLSAEPTEISVSLPAAPNEIHRLGAQFPGVKARLLISSLELPDVALGERVALAWRQLNHREPLGNSGVNFLRGPTILGLSLNYYVLAALFTACGVFALARLLRHKTVPVRALLLIVFLAWLPMDVLATRNLWQQAREEQTMLCGKPRAEQIAVTYGERLAWMYEELRRVTPPGSEYVVISNDVFAPAHRLDYLLAPMRTRSTIAEWAFGPTGIDSDRKALERYVVFIECPGAQYDPAERVVRWRSIAEGGRERFIGSVELISRNNLGDMILRFSAQ